MTATVDRIALIGFMGSGKTTVGRILAARLGWDFADTDALVEDRAGAPISRIFSDKGETWFRECEARVLEDLTGRSRLIVATGGGAPAQAGNRGFFTRSAAVFHLRVSLAAVRERTKGDATRPLLQKDSNAIQRLYESRRAVYNELGAAVDTDGKTPLAVAEEIIRLFRNPRRSRSLGDNA